MRLPNEAIKRESTWDRVKHMVTQVPIFRQEVLDKIIRLQRNKKVVWDGKFCIGDQVLLYKPWVTKGLNPKWDGPHTIIKTLSNRTYQLLKKDNSTSNPIYEDRLKLYKERKWLEPRIVIEQ